MKELKSWDGVDQIGFQMSEGWVIWERLSFIHDLRAEARPEVSWRQTVIVAQCNSLHTSGIGLRLCHRGLNRG